jgi:hypothetical protein
MDRTKLDLVDLLQIVHSGKYGGQRERGRRPGCLVKHDTVTWPEGHIKSFISAGWNYLNRWYFALFFGTLIERTGTQCDVILLAQYVSRPMFLVGSLKDLPLLIDFLVRKSNRKIMCRVFKSLGHDIAENLNTERRKLARRSIEKKDNKLRSIPSQYL